MKTRPFAVLCFGGLAACAGYRPARFRERPPIMDARDTLPIAVPAFRRVPESVYLSEVYLHRPIRETLDLSPYPDAGDVNSFDEVVRSSWFEPRVPDVGTMARGPDTMGPPRPPFTILPDTALGVASGGFFISDARGLCFEVVVDPPDRPEMRTAAVAIASRIMWALGFNTPAAHIVKVRPEDFWRAEGAPQDVPAILKAGAAPSSGFYRVAALAWPPSVQLGYSPDRGVRGDDPNDLVPHEDRRTLRTLGVFASFIGLEGLGHSKTLDAYVGAPREGHVVHFVAGLDSALGASNVVRATDPPPVEGGGSPFVRLVTLGLAPNPPPTPTQVDVLAVGALDPRFDPASFAPSMRFEPTGRLLPADAYWAAKRVAHLSPTHIALAVDAGHYGDRRAQRMMQAALEARRLGLVRYWFARATPIEVVSLMGTRLALGDEAVKVGLLRPDETDYRIDFFTSNGNAAADPRVVRPSDGKVDFILPDGALVAARDYLVVQVTARRGDRMLPRAFELHMKLVGDRPIVVGIRH